MFAVIHLYAKSLQDLNSILTLYIKRVCVCVGEVNGPLNYIGHLLTSKISQP